MVSRVLPVANWLAARDRLVSDFAQKLSHFLADRLEARHNAWLLLLMKKWGLGHAKQVRKRQSAGSTVITKLISIEDRGFQRSGGLT